MTMNAIYMKMYYMSNTFSYEWFRTKTRLAQMQNDTSVEFTEFTWSIWI